jgi:hypothetical protein
LVDALPCPEAGPRPLAIGIGTAVRRRIRAVKGAGGQLDQARLRAAHFEPSHTMIGCGGELKQKLGKTTDQFRPDLGLDGSILRTRHLKPMIPALTMASFPTEGRP